MAQANRPTDVFRNINMHGGDKTVCWEWMLSLSNKGRPYFTVNRRKYLSYRIAYELIHGVTLDPKDVLRHKCDNPACCNPYHLEIGTHEDNMNDMVERDRHGMPHHTVRAIRKLLDEGRTHQVIADLYGVSRETITAINNNRRRSKVT